MRHVEKALNMMAPKFEEGVVPEVDLPHTFIHIDNIPDEKGVAPVVKFQIQSDPIGEVGVNGCQAVDMLQYVTNLFISLNDAFPCEENARTIEAMNNASLWQVKRTQDRETRGVEGQNKG